MLIGRQLSNQNQERTKNIIDDIHQAEFKVFSQWGDDGIIQFLINYLDISNQFFIEFGVENYKEANTRFLMMNNNWSGLIIDGSEKNIQFVKSMKWYHYYDLIALHEFVTCENINKILDENNIHGEIGLLHIDIDGNDYWIWKTINTISPVIVIVEYNSLFGSDKHWTIPYNPTFDRTKAHPSNLYYGASISALCQLANEKGYAFIGSNSNGNNAYFIRNDKLKGLKVLSPEEGYVYSKFKEGRNSDGSLSFLRAENRYDVIRHLPVYNTLTCQYETIV
ncbi:MAG TPA: hypothetical protein PLB63_11640 [Planctomycetota bacterium]|nr:hypothetical protein [Planctomycetota bacterium]